MDGRRFRPARSRLALSKLARAAASAALLLGSLAAAHTETSPSLTCDADKAAFTSAPTLRSLAARLIAEKPAKILAIGSSSTEGVGASSPAASYPAQLETKLRAAWPDEDVGVVNAGIGGETADETLARLEKAVEAPAKPDLVLWQVGTNDAVRGADEAAFRAMVQRGLAMVRRAGIDLILIDQQFFPKIADVPRYERYVRAVAEVANAAGVPVFSRYALMKGWAAKDPKMLDGMLSADAFHMGDRGYGCLAGALSNGLIDTMEGASGGAVMVRGRKVAPTVAGVRKG